MPRQLGLMLLLLSFPLLAACQQTAPRPFLATVDPGSYLSYAAGQGPVAVEVFGTPIPDQPPATVNLQETVRASLQGRNVGPVIELDVQTPEKPDASPPAAARYLVHFDGTVTGNAYDRCAGREATTAQNKSAETLRVHLDFCYGDRLLSSIRGEMPRPAGLSDPGLKALLGQLMHRVVPLNPDNRNGCNGLRCS